MSRRKFGTLARQQTAYAEYVAVCNLLKFPVLYPSPLETRERKEASKRKRRTKLEMAKSRYATVKAREYERIK